MTTQEVEEAMDHLTPEELDGIDDFIEQYYSHEDNEESDSSVNVAVTITEHQAQLLHASEDGIYHPAIIDNGADTCVLGKGWELIAKYPNRKANVIGFDNDIAVKRHLPIVSAITAVDVGDDTYLLRVNEAVYNESAQHSLLSDYQLRERERESTKVGLCVLETRWEAGNYIIRRCENPIKHQELYGKLQAQVTYKQGIRPHQG